MPFLITIRRSFPATHALRLADDSLEPTHGHDWQVTLTLGRRDGGLDEIGLVADFHEVERVLESVIAPLRDAHLNDVPPFVERNPSAEHVVEHVGRQVSMKLPEPIVLKQCEITEAEGCTAIWLP